MAIFLAALGGFTIAVHLTVLSLIFLICATSTAFVAGYFYRADLVAKKRRPWPQFLTVQGDDDAAS